MLFYKHNTVLGYQTKTYSIELAQNTSSYPLTNQSALGMPDNAKILGITFRMSGQDYLNHKIDSIPAERAFLTLKNKASNAIFNNVPLYRLDPFYKFTTYMGYVNPFFQPHLNCEMDWIGSTITFANPASITTGYVLEYTVYYTLVDYEINSVDENSGLSQYYTGNCIPDVRQTFISVTTVANQQEYNLSLSRSIGVDDQDIILGYSILQDGSDIYNAPVVNATVIAASFLTLQMGSFAVLDRLPFNVRLSYFNGIPFFPIIPRPACQFDWQNSRIYCSNASLVTTGQSYMLQLHYLKMPKK